MKTFQTPAGKTIQMKYKDGTSHIRVEFAQGGELPEEFTGVFTTEREAEFAIIRYLSKVENKKQTNKVKD